MIGIQTNNYNCLSHAIYPLFRVVSPLQILFYFLKVHHGLVLHELCKASLNYQKHKTLYNSTHLTECQAWLMVKLDVLMYLWTMLRGAGDYSNIKGHTYSQREDYNLMSVIKGSTSPKGNHKGLINFTYTQTKREIDAML